MQWQLFISFQCHLAYKLPLETPVYRRTENKIMVRRNNLRQSCHNFVCSSNESLMFVFNDFWYSEENDYNRNSDRDMMVVRTVRRHDLVSLILEYYSDKIYIYTMRQKFSNLFNPKFCHDQICERF